MLSRTALRPRQIPSLRPLRPPNRIRQQPQPRLFTQNSQLLLIAQHTPRPQLPYLSQPRGLPSQQLIRLLSSETKRRIKEQVFLTAKWTAIIWVFCFLGSIAWSGIKMEQEERRLPTPADWRFKTRQRLRQAREAMNMAPERRGKIIDWMRVGSNMRECLARLEDPDGDGKGLKEVSGDGEEILIPDVGKAGFDISDKPYEWRMGYFEVVMGCAIAAEHLEDTVLDRTRNKAYPKDVVIGPNNPDPRPMPSFVKSDAPREENCDPAFAGPEVYYMRILTGKGFTTRQKLDAAEGYGNWLDFKGLHSAAEEMYRWGIDIAKSPLLSPDTDAILDPRTNILNVDRSREASLNLLRATTALAIHDARTGNLASALPIFLSVLRARRAAPVLSDLEALQENRDNAEPEAKTDFGAAMQIIRRWMQPPHYPPPPRFDGNEPFIRESDKPTCAEGELMLYIGEILFASSKDQQSEGLGWTRQGTKIAEANLQNRYELKGDDEKRKCKECLVTGAGNWEVMLQRLVEQQATSEAREGATKSRKSWFSWRGKVAEEKTAEELHEELKLVELLRERIAREGIDIEMKIDTPWMGRAWYG